MASKYGDLLGQVFGGYEVVEFEGLAKNGDKRWKVKCAGCGNIYSRQQYRIVRNKYGCECMFFAEGSSNRSHGAYGSTEYRSWGNMKSRCNNPNVRDYPSYGGRGVRVCDRWEKFENFLADMGKKPDRFYSIDRIDNEGHYEPGNCRWATKKEQASNRRKRRWKKRPIKASQ